MITKDQVLADATSNNNHYHIGTDCGHNWRPNGKVQTWKAAKNAHRFRLPVKYGLSAYEAITDENADSWHVAGLDCANTINKEFEVTWPRKYMPG
jgi:hypothetical protein